MESTISWLFWLFPLGFIIHNIEEAIWLPAFSKTAGKFHKPVDTFEFLFALIIITLLSIVITFLFYIFGKQSFPCYLYFSFNLLMLINVFIPHLAATVVLRKYCPGLLTGILFLIPGTTYILVYGFNNEYFLFPKILFVTIPFAGLIVGSIPMLFKVGKYLKRILIKNNLAKTSP